MPSDILIICTKPDTELKPLLAAFDPTELKPDKFYYTKLKTKTGVRSIALGCSGIQGPKAAANYTAKALTATKAKYAFLTGCCAGYKVDTGTVIASTTVIDYEPVRAENQGDQIQPEHYRPPFSMISDLSHFDPETEIWKQKFDSAIVKSPDLSTLASKETTLSWKHAIVASGEQVLAKEDGLKVLCEKFHEKIRAGEK